MNNEEAFFKDIFDATGKTSGKEKENDYGFIIGSHIPFEEEPGKTMTSASKLKGYIIWKKVDNGDYKQANIIPTSLEDSKQKIIDFLLNDDLAQSG